MNHDTIVKQLRELIDDRQSLKSGKYCDAIDNEIYDNDIAALTAAIDIIENNTVKHIISNNERGGGDNDD